MDRLSAISKVMDNLEWIRKLGVTVQSDKWLKTLGEMDQLEELHRLLFEPRAAVGGEE